MVTNGNKTLLLVAAAAVLFLAPTSITAGEDKGFDKILRAYESVRQALLHDHLDGVAERSREIASTAEALRSDFSAERAGVVPAKAEEAAALLPRIAAAAGVLEKVETLKEARDAFYVLSRHLVLYRSLASGKKPPVAYCSMAKRSWLQPDGEIGNPYYGQSMARCGQIVDR